MVVQNSTKIMHSTAFDFAHLILSDLIRAMLANSPCDLSSDRAGVSQGTAKVSSLYARKRFPRRLISHLPTLAPKTERFSESRTHMQRFVSCSNNRYSLNKARPSLFILRDHEGRCWTTVGLGRSWMVPVGRWIPHREFLLQY